MGAWAVGAGAGVWAAGVAPNAPSNDVGVCEGPPMDLPEVSRVDVRARNRNFRAADCCTAEASISATPRFWEEERLCRASVAGAARVRDWDPHLQAGVAVAAGVAVVEAAAAVAPARPDDMTDGTETSAAAAAAATASGVIARGVRLPKPPPGATEGPAMVTSGFHPTLPANELDGFQAGVAKDEGGAWRGAGAEEAGVELGKEEPPVKGTGVGGTRRFRV